VTFVAWLEAVLVPALSHRFFREGRSRTTACILSVPGSSPLWGSTQRARYDGHILRPQGVGVTPSPLPQRALYAAKGDGARFGSVRGPACAAWRRCSFGGQKALPSCWPAPGQIPLCSARERR